MTQTVDNSGEHQPAVLVVDDTPANLIAMRALLKPLNVHIVEADNGNDALKATLEQDFALVLLDVQMPGMDGYEVAELMRESDVTANTPIIFVTASHQEFMQRLKGYEVGAVDYIGKPLDEDILRSKVGVFVELFNVRKQLQGKMEETQLLNERLKETQETLIRDIMRPLNDIRTVAFKAALKQADELDEDWVRRLEDVADNSEQMVDTLSDMLDRHARY